MGLQGYVGSGEDVRRIRRQEAKREKEKEQFEAAKRQSDANIDSAGLRKFDTGATEALERAFKDETAGLVTRAEFLNKRDTLAERVAADAQRRKREAEDAAAQAKEQDRRKKARKASQSKLSFASDADEDQDEQDEDADPSTPPSIANGSLHHQAVKVGIGKNPHVPTDFLPDREREAAEQNLRQQLRTEYQLRQQAVKNEALEITYSYWDGAGHRRHIKVRKGDTIEQFLGKVRDQLSPEFRELRATSTSDLLYVKEDLIIPSTISFYDLIVGRARGKSGPLFHFDVHDDIRAVNDASIEKDESHAGKVVDRHWYNRNKHIFPASRWELFDPEKQFNRYTVHGE